MQVLHKLKQYYHSVCSDLLRQEVDSQRVLRSVCPQLNLSQHLQ